MFENIKLFENEKEITTFGAKTSKESNNQQASIEVFFPDIGRYNLKFDLNEKQFNYTIDVEGSTID